MSSKTPPRPPTPTKHDSEPTTFGLWFEKEGTGYVMHVMTAPKEVFKAWTAKSYLGDLRAIVLSRCLMVLEDVFDSL